MKIIASIEITAPVSKVFELFTDLRKIEENVSGIKSIEVLDGPAKMAIGTKWKETRVMLGKEASEVMTVSDIHNNLSYDVVAASHGMEYKSSYVFKEANNVTSVEMIFAGIPKSFMSKLFTPVGYLFKGATKKTLVADMKELKIAAENS